MWLCCSGIEQVGALCGVGGCLLCFFPGCECTCCHSYSISMIVTFWTGHTHEYRIAVTAGPVFGGRVNVGVIVGVNVGVLQWPDARGLSSKGCSVCVNCSLLPAADCC